MRIRAPRQLSRCRAWWVRCRRFAPELHPDMYFARVALAKVIGLSPEASSWLSVLGNSIACIGHAIEEISIWADHPSTGALHRPASRVTLRTTDWPPSTTIDAERNLEVLGGLKL